MNHTLITLFVALMLLPVMLQANDREKLIRIQHLTRQMDDVDRSIKDIERRGGESVVRNAGATHEFIRLNDQLNDLKAQRNDIKEEIRRLSTASDSQMPPLLPQLPVNGGSNIPSQPPSGGPCAEDLSGVPSFTGIECTQSSESHR